MMRARVVSDGERGFDRLEQRLQQDAPRRVFQAASAAASVANDRGGNTAGFRPGRVRGTHEGFECGIAGKFISVIFNKGSLGKRRGALKRDRRKESWTVDRRGTEYEAKRNPATLSDASKGVAPRNMLNPARLAGRRILTRR